MENPLITVVIPSLNHGKYIEKALISVLESRLPLEIFIMDGGSSDQTIHIIKKWESEISGWRSYPDKGQASAINEGVKLGKSPYICWLNSDDYYLENGLNKMVDELGKNSKSPIIYGKVMNFNEKDNSFKPVKVEKFNIRQMTKRCIISQPATLIRRSCFETVGGLDEKLELAMDYDLWWKLYQKFNNFVFLDKYIAVNREHKNTKTNTNRKKHYKESMSVVKKYNGSIPLNWWINQPYSIWFRSIKNMYYD